MISNSRYVVIVRDPLDIVASYLEADRRGAYGLKCVSGPECAPDRARGQKAVRNDFQ